MRRPFFSASTTILARVCVLIFISVGWIAAQNPSITSISPNHGYTGDQITISGSNFGSVQGAGHVGFGGTYATPVSWSDTQIVVTVPPTWSGNVNVAQNNTASNNVSFTFDAPVVASISPNHGYTGDQVTITGSHFGSAQGNYGHVGFGGTYATPVSWSDTQIVVTVPPTWSGNVNVAQNNTASNNVSFTFDAPVVASVAPTAAAPGAQVTISGTHFGEEPKATTGTSRSVLPTLPPSLGVTRKSWQPFLPQFPDRSRLRRIIRGATA